MGLPTYYNTGTVSVAAGGTAVTGSGTGWGDDVLLKGDLLMDPAQPAIPPQRIASITDNTHLVLAFPWPGTAMVAAPYEIRFVGDIERSTAQTRRYLELLGAVDNTGIGIDAFGPFADRALYDAMPPGFTFLSMDGAGAGGGELIYIREGSAAGGWSDPIDVNGPAGPPGLIGNWRGAWTTATAYAVNDAVQQGGSSYIAVSAHTSGVFATDLAAGKWQLTAAAGTPGGLYILRAVATANVALATGLVNGATIDGVALATGNVVLLTGQTAPAENGPYSVVASGAASRTPGYTTYDAIAGQYFGVMEGTAKADTLWRVTSNRGGTLGTTALVIAEVTTTPAAGSVTNAQLANMATGTIKGRATALAGPPEDLTVPQARALLSVREVITAARTYYVRTDGNDANTGLADTAGGAFLTIQKGLDAAASIDSGIYDVVVQVGAGTWTAEVVLPQCEGKGQFTLRGNTATPASVLLNVSSGLRAIYANNISTPWIVEGFKLQASAAGASGIWVNTGARLTYRNIDFGACNTAHVRVDNSAMAFGSFGPTTISGATLIHWMLDGGAYLFDAGNTITLVSTPAFANAFLQQSGGSIAKINNNTFVGTFIGKRFALTNGSVANVNGAGVNYLPGTIAGTVSVTSAYDEAFNI